MTEELNGSVSLPAWLLVLSEIHVCSATVCPSSSYTDPSRPLDAGSCLPVYQSCAASPAAKVDMMKETLVLIILKVITMMMVIKNKVIK